MIDDFLSPANSTSGVLPCPLDLAGIGDRVGDLGGCPVDEATVCGVPIRNVCRRPGADADAFDCDVPFLRQSWIDRVWNHRT